MIKCLFCLSSFSLVYAWLYTRLGFHIPLSFLRSYIIFVKLHLMYFSQCLSVRSNLVPASATDSLAGIDGPNVDGWMTDWLVGYKCFLFPTNFRLKLQGETGGPRWHPDERWAEGQGNTTTTVSMCKLSGRPTVSERNTWRRNYQ